MNSRSPFGATQHHYYGSLDTEESPLLAPHNESPDVAFSPAPSFLGKKIEHVSSTRNNTTSIPSQPLTAQKSFLLRSQERETFSLPITWERTSVEEAYHYYKQQYVATIDSPVISDRHHRYKEIISLLKKYLGSQNALKKAIVGKQSDTAALYRAAYFGYRYGIEALQQEKNQNSFYNANVNEKIADRLAHVAFLTEKVIEATKPTPLTGALTITTRENGLETKHNLSEFSFKEEGSLTSYYHLITSSNIVSGSNFPIIKQQAALIERTYAHLAKIHAMSYPQRGSVP